MNSTHKKQVIKSNYHFNIFSEVATLFRYGSESWERVNILLTKFQQRTFHNDYVLGKDGEIRYVYSTRNEIRSILGSKKWVEILTTLEDNNILVRVDSPNPFNSTQQLYTFEGVYLEPTVWKYKVVNLRVHKSLDNFYDKKHQTFSKMVGGVILTNFRKTKINITDGEYWNAVEGNYNNYCEGKRYVGAEPMNYNSYLKQYEYLLYRIRAFNGATGKELYDFISEDKFSGRVHTIITQLPKFIRKLGVIEISGHKVNELDLKQSQPTILSKLLEGTDYFNWFVQQNDCYEALQQEFDIPSRDYAKRFMFTLMFSTVYSKYHKQFCTMFPIAGDILTQMKSTYNPLNPNSIKGNYHSNVAWELQQRETTIFRNIWRKLNKAGVEFLTIHDAVLVPVHKIDITFHIMQKELSNSFPTAQVNYKQTA